MFKIVEISPPFIPIQRRIPVYNTLDEFDSRPRERCISSHALFISKDVWIDEIGQHIGWGKRTPINIVEQGGILLGKTYFDTVDNIYYGEVTKAISGDLARGNPAYLDMTHETWKAMLDKADDIIDNEDQELQVIGWYHTHPNNLSVFMSGTDMGTQRTFFNKDWQFAIVINPHQKIWRAFFGMEAHECKGYVYDGIYYPDKKLITPKSRNYNHFKKKQIRQSFRKKLSQRFQERINK